jgi:hypothetical protein
MWEKLWTWLIWPTIGTGGGSCECGNKSPCFIKCGKFLD